MKLTILNDISILIISIVLFITGILFIINYETFWLLIYVFLILYLTFNAINKIINKKLNLALIIDLLGIIVLFFNRRLYYVLIHILFGWWLLLNSFVLFIEYYIARKDFLQSALSKLIMATINLILGLTIVLGLIKSYRLLSIFIGIYLIFLGLTEIYNYILLKLPNKIKSKISLSMPIILSMLLPSKVYVSIDKLIKENKVKVNEKNDNKNIEILIHIKGTGNESIGHVDVAVDDYIYSYGLHDPKTRKLHGTLGEGVLFKVNKEAFIKQGIYQENKMIISYTLKTTKEQRNIINNRINQLLEQTYPFKPDAQILKEENKPYNHCYDYASRVYRFTNAKMFKFNSGKFKTYFAATTNCVLLSDYLVRSKELNLIKINGIVTPGTYLQFLTNELRKKDGKVSNYKIYYHQDNNFLIKRYNALKKQKDYIAIRKQVLNKEESKYDKMSTHVVIYSNKKPIGTGSIYQDDSLDTYIDNVCVLKEYRNKKVGTIIMNNLEPIGFAWGDTIKIKSTPTSKDFFIKLGYKQSNNCMIKKDLAI